MFRSCEKSISRKKPVLYIAKFRSLVLPGNTTMITAPYYPISCLLSVSVRLQEIKNKRKFQTFSSKSGRGRLWEVVAYKGSQCNDLAEKLLVFWKTGRRGEVVAYERWSQPELRLYLHQACEGVNLYLWTLNFSAQEHASSKSWHILNLRVMAVSDIKLWTCFSKNINLSRDF